MPVFDVKRGRIWRKRPDCSVEVVVVMVIVVSWLAAVR